jgi:hypothetical protein
MAIKFIYIGCIICLHFPNQGPPKSTQIEIFGYANKPSGNPGQLLLFCINNNALVPVSHPCEEKKELVASISGKEQSITFDAITLKTAPLHFLPI